MGAKRASLRTLSWLAGAIAVVLVALALHRAVERRELVVRPAFELGGPKGVVPTALAFSPAGDLLATGWSDCQVRLFDSTGEGPPVLALASESRASVVSVSFSPEGRLLATGENGGAFRLWSLRGTGVALGMNWQENSVRQVAFSPDGERVAAALAGDGRVRLFATADRSQVAAIRTGFAGVSRIAWATTGEIVVTETDAPRFAVFGPGERTARFVFQEPSGSHLSALAVSPAGDLVAYGTRAGAVRVVSTTGTLRHTLRDAGPEVRSIAFSPSGNLLAIAGPAGAAIVAIQRGWPPFVLRHARRGDDGSAVAKASDTAGVVAIAVSLTTGRLATAGEDGVVRIWPVPWD